MNINVDTKYNIGDEVYFIQEEFIDNDHYSYSANTKWLVGQTDFDKRKYIKLKINKIVLEYNDSIKVYYLIDNSYKIDENNVFYDLDEAKNKCIKLNNKTT